MLKKVASLLLSGAMLLTMGISPTVTAVPSNTLSVYDLNCEYLVNPEVIDTSAPRLGWKISSAQRGVMQTAYQVLVSASLESLNSENYDAWDSGKVETSDTTAIAYEGSFESGKDYFWQVKVWDNKGNTAISEPAKFGAGLLSESDWSNASWISPTESELGDAENYDYSVSMRFQVQSNSENKSTLASVIIGAVDSSNYYMYQICEAQNPGEGNGYLALKPHEKVNGNWIAAELVKIPSSVVGEDKAFDAWNNIIFDYVDGTVTTTINGTKIDERKYNNKFVSTVIGFRAYQNNTSRERGLYDDIVITKDGETVYSEDFSDDNWEYDVVGGAGSAEISDSAVDIVPSGFEVIVFANHPEENPDEALTKYTVEYRFELQSIASGVIFGAKDRQNFLMWQYNENDDSANQKVVLRPHVWAGGGASLLAQVDISSAVSWDDRRKPHTMRIEVDGKTATTYIDDIKIDTRSNLPFEGYGELGFRHGANPNELSKVDYIKSYDTEGNILFEDNFDSSDMFQFETGNVADGWLTVGQTAGGEYSWQGSTQNTYLLRKDFKVSNKTIKRAKIYSSALGLYEMHLNGTRIGDDYFAPGWTDYNIRVQYQGYDVTKQVKSGDNALGVMVAPGWFSGAIGFRGGNSYGIGTGFICKLVIDYSDGTSDTIITDNSWKYADSPIVKSDLFHGELYVASKELGTNETAWATVDVDYSQWDKALVRHKKSSERNLVAQIDPPVQITEVLDATEMWENNGKVVVDFGQNFAGVVKMNLKGKPGDKITLRFSEALDKNRAIDNLNYRDAKATDYYVIGERGEGTYQPRFTFHGFRYAEITGMNIADLKLTDIKGIVYSSNLKLTGSFESSSDLVNQLYSNIVWGQRGNYLSVPTDCPQRDERLGWTGDSEVFVRTGSYNMDSMAFNRKHIIDIIDAQTSNGAYPDVAPNVLGWAGNAAWGDAGVIVPYTMYLQYGDAAILEESYESMTKWISYYQTTDENLIIPDCAYGDWLSVNEETPKNLVATAFFAYSTQLVAKIAEILGKTEDVTKYTQLWNDIKTAYTNRFITSAGVCGNGSQASYVLSLSFELVPEDLAQKAADLLADNIMNKRGGHLTTGFVTVGRLCPVLTKYGHTDVAYKLLTNKTYPSWGYSIERGATTIWERWNSCLDDGTIDNSMVAMNSLNHYSLGSIGEWMFTDSLGIELDEQNPGFKHIIFQPQPYNNENINMTYANGSYDSIHGEIYSSWSFDENGKLIYEVKVPANTTATMSLPVPKYSVIYENGKRVNDAEGVTYVEYKDDAAVYALGSGHYKFAFSKEDSIIEIDEVILGDINGDNKVTVTDVVALRSIIMGDTELTPGMMEVADINKDNALTVTDIVGLRSIIMN